MFLIRVSQCDLSGKLNQVAIHQSVSVRSMTIRGDSDGLGGLPRVGRCRLVKSASFDKPNTAVLQLGLSDSILAPLSRSKAMITALLSTFSALFSEAARCSGVRSLESTVSILAPLSRSNLSIALCPQ